MDRGEYLNMCRDCAMMKERGFYGVLKNVPDELRVVYREMEFYPVSYELGFFENGQVNHIAKIHDLKTNSVCYVPLKDLTRKENKNG